MIPRILNGKYVSTNSPDQTTCRNLAFPAGIFDAVAVSIWEEDISELLRFFDALRQHGVLDLRDYVGRHPEFVVQASKMVRIVNVNEATLELYEARSKEEFLGSLDKVFTPESYRAFGEVLSALFDGNKSVILEATNRTLSGKTIDVIINFSIPTGETSFGNMLVSIIDNTERKRVEKELQSREELYRTISSVTSDYVFKCSRKDGEPLRIQWLAGAVEAITGYSESEVLAMGSLLSIVHPGDAKSVGARLSATKLGDRSTAKYRIISKSGSIKWINEYYHCAEGRMAGELVFYGAAQDITLQEELHAQFLRKQRLDSLGVLAGGIAHDFNNILTGVMGNISLAQVYTRDLHKRKRALQNAENATELAAGLARQLLTFARGGQPLRGNVPVHKLVNEVLSFSLMGSAVKGSIRIKDTVRSIEGDEGQLNQALTNLIINAAQAMSAGGSICIQADTVTVEAVNRYALKPGQYVKIAVTDCGCGIPAHNLDRIFDPFFSTKAGGTGLGLTTVHSIVSRHGGSVEVNSTVGEGTTFTLYLPASECIL